MFHRFIIFFGFVNFVVCGISLENLVAKIILNYKLKTLVILSDEHSYRKIDLPTLIFTSKITNINLSKICQKQLLLLVDSNDPEILLIVQELLLDNTSFEARVVFVTNFTDIQYLFKRSLYIGNMDVGIYSTVLRNFYTFKDPFDFESNSMFLESNDGKYFLKEPPSNFHQKIMNIRVIQINHLNNNCTWIFCRFVKFFQIFFNISVNVTAEKPRFQPTIDFRNNTPQNKNYTYASFLQYRSVNIAIPNIQKEIERYLYFIVPFCKKLWNMMFAIILFFTILFSIISKLQNGKFNFEDSFFITLSSFLFQNMKESKKQKKVFTVILFVLGLFMGIFYTSNMGNLLTTNLSVSKFQILCSKVFQKNISNKSHLHIEIVNNTEYYKAILNMNTNYGYCIDNDTWEKFQNIQKGLLTPFFKILQKWESLGIPFTFVMKRNSVFREQFNKFYMKCHIFGFFVKWKREERDVHNLGSLLQTISKTRAFRSKDMFFPYIIYLCGVNLSFIIFGLENCIFKIKKFNWYYFKSFSVNKIFK